MVSTENDMHSDTLLLRYLRGLTSSNCNKDDRLPRQRSHTNPFGERYDEALLGA